MQIQNMLEGDVWWLKERERERKAELGNYVCQKKIKKQDAILNSVVKRGLIVTFEQSPEGTWNKNPKIKIIIEFEFLNSF